MFFASSHILSNQQLPHHASLASILTYHSGRDVAISIHGRGGGGQVILYTKNSVGEHRNIVLILKQVWQFPVAAFSSQHHIPHLYICNLARVVK
jgi:hypothetical protein